MSPISSFRPFGELLNSLREFKKQEDQKVMNAARRLEEQIIELNQEQLYQGQYAAGGKIKPRYAPYTIAVKTQKGQPTDRVTLSDTGDFYEGFDVHFSRKHFELDSLDDKTQDLINKYQAGIFGLSKENLDYFITEFYRESLQAEFRKTLLK